MIAWKNEAEAIGYAASRLDDALDLVGRDVPHSSLDHLQMAQEAINEATAALVLVQHTRQGDALVTIDQLVSDLDDTRAAQPRRQCCQTYIGEDHATRCRTWGSSPLQQAMANINGRVARSLGQS